MPRPARIPIARPWLDEREAEASRRVILSGWLTQGPEVAAFEREFATAVEAPYACAVSSCTTGLHLALHVAGVRAGDEVITASHSFIATANAIRYCGATPVFADIDPQTYTLDPQRVAQLLGRRTKAILCVHQMGMPCDLTALRELADRHGVPLIEDAACAAGSQIRWQNQWEPIGRPHGHVAVFSFHPRKVITTGDGGMITTGDRDWDQQFRTLRQHAMTVPDTVRHAARAVIAEEYTALGFNYRMTDVQAAIGRVQLERLPEIVARRRVLAERYATLLADVAGVRPPTEPAWARSNWQSYCVRLPAGVGQHAVMQALLDQGVSTRRGIMCSHREQAYALEPWSCGSGPGLCGCKPGTCRRLPESERAQDETLLLPLYPQMTDEQQDYVVAQLAAAIAAPVGAQG